MWIPAETGLQLPVLVPPQNAAAFLASCQSGQLFQKIPLGALTSYQLPPYFLNRNLMAAPHSLLGDGVLALRPWFNND